MFKNRDNKADINKQNDNRYGSEKLKDDQKIEVLDHCNKFGINPMYGDMDGFYVDWVYDH